MSWKLALEYIRTFIWPITVLTLGFLFKKQVSGLIARLQSVETPVGSATFENQANSVADEAAEIQEELTAELAASRPDREPQGLDEPPATVAEPTHPREFTLSPDAILGEQEEERLPSYAETKMSREKVQELMGLAESHPTTAVHMAWREVERAVDTSLTLDRKPRRNLTQSLRRVADLGIVSSDVMRLASDLLQLRNRVAHEEGVELTSEGARSYVTAAQRVIDALALARSSTVRARLYEEEIYRALLRHASRVERNVIIAGKKFDFLIEDFGGRQAVIDTKFRSDSPLLLKEVQHAVSGAGKLGVLVITNARLTEKVREFNSQRLDNRPPVEVIQWRDRNDDDLLIRALARTARDLEPPASP